MTTRQTFGWQRLLLGGALLAAAALAQAQFAWIDDKGLRQYSDRPPPPSVPLKRILKAPGLAPPPDAAAASPSASAAATRPEPGTAERNADFRKRKVEAAEEEQQGADAARRQGEIDSHCNTVRQSKQLLESGRRIGTTDKAGEAGYLSDEQRAVQIAKAQRALADCR